MAREVFTQITDDIDGSKDATEVRFSFDGVDYSIDLNKKNRAALEKTLKPYIDAATKVPRRSSSRNRAVGKATRRDLGAIRAWAQQQGIQVSDRGRVSQSVIDQYEAAQ